MYDPFEMKALGYIFRQLFTEIYRALFHRVVQVF